MSYLQKKPPSVLRKFWDAVGAVGNLQTLWQLAAALGVAKWKLAKMNVTVWNNPDPWITLGLWFFGTWAIVGTVMQGTKYAMGRIRRIVNRPQLQLIPGGGTKAIVTLMHTGEPTSYTAEGRIVGMIDESPVRWPHLFRYQLIFADSGAWVDHPVPLCQDGWAQIELASIVLNAEKVPTLQIHCGGQAEVGVAFLGGAIIELTIRAKPPLKGGTQRRRFEVKQIDHWSVSCTEKS